MIGVGVWARWPWSLVRLVCQVRKQKVYRRAWMHERIHADLGCPWREWTDLGGEAGGA